MPRCMCRMNQAIRWHPPIRRRDDAAGLGLVRWCMRPASDSIRPGIPPGPVHPASASGPTAHAACVCSLLTAHDAVEAFAGHHLTPIGEISRGATDSRHSPAQLPSRADCLDEYRAPAR